jgi:dolichol-phosphate mannosyltransferase
MNRKKQYRKLSIIVPVFNEEATILRAINAINAVRLQMEKEIIIVDDGSTDKTAELIHGKILTRQKDVIYLRHETNQGKGQAIRTALKHLTGDIVLIQDADLEYDPQDYPKLLEPLVNGKARVVFGSRYLYSKLFQPLMSAGWIYKWGGYFVTKFFNLIYGVDLTDEPTCYKVFDADLLKSIRLNCERFEFCPEVAGKVVRLGERIEEVPIRYRARSVAEGKKIRVSDGLEALRVMLRYRFSSPYSFLKIPNPLSKMIVPEYCSRNPLVRKIFFDRIGLSLNLARLEPGDRILDMGTGCGIMLRALTVKNFDLRLVGMDLHPGISELKNMGFDVNRGDARGLPYRSDSFEVVFCLDVLEHIKDLEAAVLEIHRVMKDGGQLVVSLPEESFIYKFGRLLLKGQWSQETGPASSPHFWNAEEVFDRLRKRFVLSRSSAIYAPFPLFRIAQFTKREE